MCEHAGSFRATGSQELPSGGTARQGEKVVHGMAYDQRAVLIGPTRRQARGAAVGWLNALAGAERARPIAGPAVTESVPQ